MKNSKHFWRSLFFFLLIITLCGGLALPVVEGSPARAAPQMQAATNIVISEFRTRGPSAGNDEFVEIYNPTATPIDVSGWLLRASNSSGGTGTRYTFPAGTVIQPGQHYIIVGSNYSGSIQETPVASLSGGIADDGGIAITLSDGSTIIDQVGMSAGSAYGEGARLAPLTTSVNRSYERNLEISGSCVDSNINNLDFFERSPSDPQNSSSSITTCGNPTPTPTSTFTSTSTNTPTDTGTPTNTGTPTDTGTPTNTSTATATITITPTGVAGSVVISEFRTRGARGANDEFIELYNPTSAIIDISGWKINASNESGGISTRATIPASTILRSGQYYLVANNASNDGYNNPSVPPNLTYGTGISDNGGVALLRADNTIVDQVGMHTGSAYKEGTILSPLSENVDRSYERKAGGTADSCQDTNNNANDFLTRPLSNPHNYASQLSRCGTLLFIPVLTVTTITSDTPDPSLVNSNVTVSVRVTGGSPLPSGIVNITGANTNCSITLNSSGTGSCIVRFTTTGTKTLTATYVGDQTHLTSSDTETHQVSTTIRTPTPTRPATPQPPPPLLVINEFVPRPGHDWNLDGVINTDDEYIEILNHGVIDVSLNGYSLDDEVNIGSAPFRLPADVTLKPGERRVFYGSQTGLLLSDGGDGVRLLRPNGQLMDAYNYRVARFPDHTYCRLPDNGGADDWNQNCFPTPGLQNSLSGNAVNPPTSGDAENLCPIADTLPEDFLYAECLPFGNNIWNPAYWDRLGWYDEKNLPESTGKWPVFVD